MAALRMTYIVNDYYLKSSHYNRLQLYRCSGLCCHFLILLEIGQMGRQYCCQAGTLLCLKTLSEIDPNLKSDWVLVIVLFQPVLSWMASALVLQHMTLDFLPCQPCNRRPTPTLYSSLCHRGLFLDHRMVLWRPSLATAHCPVSIQIEALAACQQIGLLKVVQIDSGSEAGKPLNLLFCVVSLKCLVWIINWACLSTPCPCSCTVLHLG